MRTFEELKKFYNSEMYPELEVLEQMRIKAKNKIITAGAVVLTIALILAYMLRYAEDLPFIIVILAVIIVIGIYRFSIGEYVKGFKAGVIEKLVKFLDKGLSYSKMNSISRNAFVDSKIFQRTPDEYNGDDYVRGRIGQTEVEFSEIHAKYVTRDSKGRRQVHTIFKGLFFIADFNKHFSGRTVVLPDTAERLFGQFGSMLQGLNKFRGQLIKLEDPEFEKMFAVYGDDQVEARYILSTSLMKRIGDFKKRTNRPVHLSFVGSKVNIAVSYRKDLFEPRVFRTMLDFTPIQEYFEDLQMAVGIVEDLNLNTRIWSK